MATNQSDRKTDVLSFESSVGYILNVGVSGGVKTDHRSQQTSVTGCLSVGVGYSAKLGSFSYQLNSDEKVSTSFDYSGGLSINGFAGGGALAGSSEFQLGDFNSLYPEKQVWKFELQPINYGINKEQGLVGIGAGIDLSAELCGEVNPKGLWRDFTRELEETIKDLYEVMDSIFDIDNDAQNSIRDSHNDFGYRSNDKLGTLAESSNGQLDY